MATPKTDAVPGAFPETRWSIVQDARGAITDRSRPAMERLVRTYWGPVYAMVRRGWRESREDAKDLTQEFFTRLLAGGAAEGFDPGKGRFRSFLFAAVKHFMLQRRRDESRLKRGGGKRPFALAGLEEMGSEPASPEVSPEGLFHEEWVAAVLREAIADLGEECRLAGKEIVFKVFEIYDLEEADRPTYDAIAQRLGISAHDVHNALTQARRRLREIIRAQVRETLSTPEDLDDEMRLLFG